MSRTEAAGSRAGARLRELTHFIGGQRVEPASGRRLEALAPATQERIGSFPRGDARDVRAAVAAARSAYPAWRDRPAAERAAVLERAADLLSEPARAEDFATQECLDTGRPISFAREIDVPRAVRNLRFYAEAVRQDATQCFESTGALSYVTRRPLGPVAVITPWNLPLLLLTWKSAPALALGNTVVAKPSELSPLTASAFAELLHEAGAPAGVFNVVHGDGEAGQALVEDPHVRAISFTGGTRTGEAIARAAAATFKKVSLELSGKNPALIFADADFEQAVRETVRSGFSNQGQICLCTSRILVEEPIFERFVGALVDETRTWKIGDPFAEDTKLGSLISQDHRRKVETYLDAAREEGGRFLVGGGRPDLPPPLAAGAYLEPAVIAGLAHDARAAIEEIFGPVVTVHPFRSEEEAVALANEPSYGLCASVWTSDLRRAHRLAAALETGMVWVNTWMLRDLRSPFGGEKDSGVGREGGSWSLDFFSHARNVTIRLD